MAKPTRDELINALRIVTAALDDASSVVDAGEGEAYAYQAELELARATLAREIEKE